MRWLPRLLAAVLPTTQVACSAADPPLREPAPVEVAIPASSVPRALPLASSFTPFGAEGNPFAVVTEWEGDYVCSQGPTKLTLQVISVKGPEVVVISEFFHEGRNVRGSFRARGTFEKHTRGISLRPEAWIGRPNGWTYATFSGHVSADGLSFDGRIEHPNCGDFHLRKRAAP